MASREGPNRTEERTEGSVDSLGHPQSGTHSMTGQLSKAFDVAAWDPKGLEWSCHLLCGQTASVLLQLQSLFLLQPEFQKGKMAASLYRLILQLMFIPVSMPIL